MKISCLILTSDSNIDKGFCLRHSLLSICMQNYEDFEVIIIDNSNYSKSSKLIEQAINSIFKKINKKIGIRLVKPEKPLSRGAGRNFGASFCTGDYIVFLDDDAIILSENAFSMIDKYSNTYEFGYGAKRYWTEPFLWFNENSDTIYEAMLKGENVFKTHLGPPPKFTRGDSQDTLEDVSFIGHFGFCKKTLFDLIGGYPDFSGWGFEDDYFMFKCFQKSGKFVKLDSIVVVHVTHTINKNSNSTITHYFNLLKKEGIFWFHVGKTFKEDNVSYTDLVEPLYPYHPDYRVLDAYNLYQYSLKKRTKLPRSTVYSLQDYCILLDGLLKSRDLNEFVKNSGSDFDSLIPVISSFLETSLCSITKGGKIKDLLQFTTFPNYTHVVDETIIPQRKFNQFPCDLNSRYKRLELIKERYPLTDHLSIALIGDDDLVSVLLGTQSRIETTVIEVDERVIDIIKKTNLPNINTLRKDLRTKSSLSLNKVQTFMTDPPYTKNGILLFIFKGLQLLDLSSDEEYEFYVILNQTMIKNFFPKIQKILSGCDIWLHEIRENFSHYELPEGYSEYTRAKVFLENNSISVEKLVYSSSSSLYIFRTKHPKLDMLRSNIDIAGIYKHDIF